MNTLPQIEIYEREENYFSIEKPLKIINQTNKA